MPRQYRHKHWPEDHPFYERAGWHEGTKKDCDERVTQFNHGHLGTPCVKEYQPTKSRRKMKDGTVRQKGSEGTVATCTIVNLPLTGLAFNDLLCEQFAYEEQNRGTLDAS